MSEELFQYRPTTITNNEMTMKVFVLINEYRPSSMSAILIG